MGNEQLLIHRKCDIYARSAWVGDLGAPEVLCPTVTVPQYRLWTRGSPPPGVYCAAHQTDSNCPSPLISPNPHFQGFYKYSFFPLAVVQWNLLPQHVVELVQPIAFTASVANIQQPRP